MKDSKIKIDVVENNTLINIISNKLKDLSNKTIKQYIKNEMVYVNGDVEKNSSRVLTKDDELIFYFKKSNLNNDLEIIYEDDDLIAINKESGLLSISNSKEKNRTAFRLVSDYVKEKDKNNKIFVVHRIDEDTSGVLLFAKNQNIQEKLQTKWNDIVKTREYYLVIPTKIKDSGRIESYLKVEKNNIVHSVKNSKDGELSITDYQLIHYNGKYSLVRVNISTDRRNQIRVHMKENFKPICGDKKYGSKDNPIGRLCLHASELSLIDPRTNNLLTIKSNIPSEFMKLTK